MPSARGEPLAERDVEPAEVRAPSTRRPSVPADDPDDGDADPDQRDRRRATGADDASTSSARSATTSLDRDVLRAAGRPGSARGPRRRGPTSATASESTAISRARTTASSGSGGPRGDGRPGVPSGAARSSETRSAATSSPIRPRIALRVSPVRATSSERDSGPRAWSSRTIALRFARRTVSLRCPISTTTGFVFLLFKCTCESVPCPGAMSSGERPDSRARPDRSVQRALTATRRSACADKAPDRRRLARRREPPAVHASWLVDRGRSAGVVVGGRPDVIGCAATRRRERRARRTALRRGGGRRRHRPASTTATSSTPSAAAWRPSTATATASPTSTSPAARARPRCTGTTARSAAPCGSAAVHDPATDLTAVNGAYPLDIDGDGHRRPGRPPGRRERAAARPRRLPLRAGRTRPGRFDGGARLDDRVQRHLGGRRGAADPGRRQLPRARRGGPAETYDCDDNELVRPKADGHRLRAGRLALTPGYCTLSMLFSDWDRTGRRDLRVSNDRHYYVDGEEQLWRVATGGSRRASTRRPTAGCRCRSGAWASPARTSRATATPRSS